MIRGSLRTVAVSVVVGSSAAVVCAVILAVIDIYLAGHGRQTLGRPWIEYAFLHVSRADVILLCCFAVSVAVAVAGRRSR